MLHDITVVMPCNMFPPTLLTGDQLFQLNRNEHAFIVEIFKKKKKKKAEKQPHGGTTGK